MRTAAFLTISGAEIVKLFRMTVAPVTAGLCRLLVNSSTNVYFCRTAGGTGTNGIVLALGWGKKHDNVCANLKMEAR